MKTTERKWLDLGDFGQHQADIVAHIDIPFPWIESVHVSTKDNVIDVVRLLPRDMEQQLIQEFTLDREIGAREFAEGLRSDERMTA